MQPIPRSISLISLLGYNRKVAWTLSFGISLQLIGLSLWLTGAPVAFPYLFTAGLLLLGLGYWKLKTLLENDLPLLRRGVAVHAKVLGAFKHAPRSLFHITYQLPNDGKHRRGVFVSPTPRQFKRGQNVVVLVNKDDPTHLLEVSGHYDDLIIPANDSVPTRFKL